MDTFDLLNQTQHVPYTTEGLSRSSESNYYCWLKRWCCFIHKLKLPINSNYQMYYHGLFWLMEGNSLLIDIYKSFTPNSKTKSNKKSVYTIYFLSKQNACNCRNSALNILTVSPAIVSSESPKLITWINTLDWILYTPVPSLISYFGILSVILCLTDNNSFQAYCWMASVRTYQIKETTRGVRISAMTDVGSEEERRFTPMWLLAFF